MGKHMTAPVCSTGALLVEQPEQAHRSCSSAPVALLPFREESKNWTHLEHGRRGRNRTGANQLLQEERRPPARCAAQLGVPVLGDLAGPCPPVSANRSHIGRSQCSGRHVRGRWKAKERRQSGRQHGQSSPANASAGRSANAGSLEPRSIAGRFSAPRAFAFREIFL